MQSLGILEDRLLLRQEVPPSRRHWRHPMEGQKRIRLGSSSRCHDVTVNRKNCLRESNSCFSSGLTPLLVLPARQRRFEISVYLHLDGLPVKVNEPRLPEATGFKAPITRLRPYSSVRRVPPGSVAEPHEKARSWTLAARGYLRSKPWEHFIGR